mmetsp:Transcript_13760/g.17071  ORF Transcript_13760/g.17071 Transcript_13760/m.17071 type:complete len:105 (+) Transcript_13760:350-664(+)
MQIAILTKLRIYFLNIEPFECFLNTFNSLSLSIPAENAPTAITDAAGACSFTEDNQNLTFSRQLPSLPVTSNIKYHDAHTISCQEQNMQQIQDSLNTIIPDRKA